MTVQFKDHADALPEIEEVDGQVVEKRFNFSLEELDYMFVFSPPSDDPAGGATLTYVGDNERGRLTPSKYAIEKAWSIANSKLCVK